MAKDKIFQNWKKVRRSQTTIEEWLAKDVLTAIAEKAHILGGFYIVSYQIWKERLPQFPKYQLLVEGTDPRNIGEQLKEINSDILHQAWDIIVEFEYRQVGCEITGTINKSVHFELLEPTHKENIMFYLNNLWRRFLAISFVADQIPDYI